MRLCPFVLGCKYFLNHSYTVSEAARSLEISINMLRRWIKEYQADDDGQAFEVMGS